MEINNKELSIIILAAGKGVRMNQDIPKVLTMLDNGNCLIENLLENIKETNYINNVSVVVGFKGDDVIDKLGNKYKYIWQRETLGTGHAVAQCKNELKGHFDNHLILYGDTPFISPATIENIINMHMENNSIFSILTLQLNNFEDINSCYMNFGRIVRDANGEITKIVEFKDATDEEKNITEVNPAIFCIKDEWLWKNLDNINSNNNQKEYYLTDLIAMAHDQGIKIKSFISKNNFEFIGVNTIEQLNFAKKVGLNVI
ncbi:MAG: NTP transferase domain-containing protein [Patescibacteria group bacterium]|nr:NTP transferase domain-containing protein [Patescibacteria group bacterium]MDD4304127.1 NTP transferase domain-containing protein [Patescibacteria group bacterium]MDD4695158.1 NTP transferase domain-containing protein [Patescibacteria group bacterium]